MIANWVSNFTNAQQQALLQSVNRAADGAPLTENAFFPPVIAAQRSASTMEVLQDRGSMDDAMPNSAAVPQSKAEARANSPKAEEKGFDLKSLFSALSDVLTKVGEFIGSVGPLLLSKADVLKKFVNLVG
ncbi:hypothetical protein [Burkholderia ubonensis]|uniref:hypothetical protein n=1 Tax=Burkholderia ubonensis TaxID=101571 RepID=UPI000B2E9466|nr:hypothetical protein [Burkholderia ubonensis]